MTFLNAYTFQCAQTKSKPIFNIPGAWHAERKLSC